MDATIEFARHIPPVAWIGLVLVLWRSAGYARARVGRADRLWVAPAIIGAFGLATMGIAVSHTGHAPEIVLTWLAAAAVGGAVGWATLHRAVIGADHPNGRITIPADWSFPPLLVLFFGVRFYVGYRGATDPAVAAHLDFALTQIVVSALIAGVFSGKAWALWRKWRGSAREMALPAR